MKVLVPAGVALAILSGNSADVRANLITNGGFETGDFTGWTTTGPDLFVRTAGGPGGYAPHSGTYFAAGGPSSPFSLLSQTFTDSTNQTLQISFFIASNGDTPNAFTASYDGGTLLDLVNLSTTDSVLPVPYIQETFSVTATGSDTLTFGFYDPPSVLALDDVSVNPASAVSEPMTLTLLAIGLAGLIGATPRLWGVS